MFLEKAVCKIKEVKEVSRSISCIPMSSGGGVRLYQSLRNLRPRRMQRCVVTYTPRIIQLR
jgi:hypothetical protein